MNDMKHIPDTSLIDEYHALTDPDWEPLQTWLDGMTAEQRERWLEVLMRAFPPPGWRSPLV
jgi:hypothetical protein